MRSCLLIFTCWLACQGHAQSRLTIGQYTYMGGRQPLYAAPVVQYQGTHNWYAEARYNYEDLKTFSAYGGYTFARDSGNWSYTVTPMMGLIAGKLQGAAGGLTAELDYKSLYISTESQYCVSSQSREENFFYTWSEAGYHPLTWLYTGAAVQHTKPYHANALFEPGFFATIAVHGWSFPVYCFLPSHTPTYFVVGILRDWKYASSGRTSTRKPVRATRTGGTIY
jgi:hypothetical protein